MELRVLRYFLGVAREGSMTGAARTLHVTQPTLSRQLQELEEVKRPALFFVFAFRSPMVQLHRAPVQKRMLHRVQSHIVIDN